MFNLLTTHWNNWHFHRWSNWSYPFRAAHSCDVLQARTCKICGKMHVKKIIQPWNMFFDISNLKEKT